MNNAVIAVTSVTFSRDPLLISRLRQNFTNVRLNANGERFDATRLAEFIGNADGVIVGLETIDKNLLTACPGVRIFAKYGVGLDNIDVDACEESSVAIGWTGGLNRLSVAEETVCFMIALFRNLFVCSYDLKQGRWARKDGTQLSGKTVGIMGVGNIGRELVRLLEPFKCRILVHDVIDQSAYYREHNLTEVSRDALFAESDVVTIHTPLTNETRNVVDRRLLSLMKPTAFLVNTARGPIVNQNDLKEALEKGVIAGAALDVFELEPITDVGFLGLPNLICTPHIGGNASEAIRALGLSAIDHLEKFFGAR